MARPVVLVTTDHRPARAEAPVRNGRVRPSRAEVHVYERIVERLREAGAAVLLLPPGDPDPLALLDLVDALVVTGGAADIHPAHYGQTVRGRLDGVDEARAGMELALAAAAIERGIPILGICGGLQAMAVASGGSLVQDIGTQIVGALEHEQPTDPAGAWHPIQVEEGWKDLFPEAVNSTHHQALEHCGALQPVARAPDGVIEAAVVPGHPFAMGVQWHPEWLDGPLFSKLVEAAGRRRAAS
jgi:putative glutamine amidotransferase